MKTADVGNLPNQYAQFQNLPKTGKSHEKSVDKPFTDPVDTFTPTPPPDMNRPGIAKAADPATIERLWNETNQVADAIRSLVASLLGTKDAAGQGFWAKRAGLVKFELSEAERAQAQELISEDGFFGVKQTTARIMDFAKALVGEGADEDQIENMRAAVQKGFDEVARMFGGFDKLPDVTKQTYEAIMKAFDEWLNGGAEEETEEEVA